MMQTNLENKMTPEQFCYWLQGFNEIRDKEQVGLSEKEWDIVRDHLQEVFSKVTPNYVTTTGTDYFKKDGGFIVPQSPTCPTDPFQQVTIC